MVAGNETLSKLLGSLYAAAADPALWEPFLEQLAQSTRATSAAMAMHDLDHTPPQFGVLGSWTQSPFGFTRSITMPWILGRGVLKPIALGMSATRNCFVLFQN